MIRRMKLKIKNSKWIFCALLLMASLCGCQGKKNDATVDDNPVVEEISSVADANNHWADSNLVEAVFLGVDNYGAAEVNKDNVGDFYYRFEIDGNEQVLKIDNGKMDAQGNYSYPIQNILKEGYSFKIRVEDGKVIAAEEINTEAESYKPPVSGNPGERTLENFLATAMMPVGTTLYIYGGGWNWQDDGSSIQTRTIGLADEWRSFFYSQDVNYTYRDKDAAHSYYPYGKYNEYYYAGLDCSGYVGWVLYNVMNKENGRDGYVMSSTKMARKMGEYGWGKWTQTMVKPVNHADSEFLPGDVFSKNGHVWICLGTCDDGSILILHSTPSNSRTGQPGGGPELSAIGASKECDAYCLADKYMSQYFPDWYERYPVVLKGYEEYTYTEGEYAGKFSWNLTGENGGLTDPDGIVKKKPEEILKILVTD